MAENIIDYGKALSFLHAEVDLLKIIEGEEDVFLFVCPLLQNSEEVCDSIVGVVRNFFFKKLLPPLRDFLIRERAVLLFTVRVHRL